MFVLDDPRALRDKCEIGVRKTSEGASVVGGGDERPLRFLRLLLHALLRLLLQRGIRSLSDVT